MTQVLLKDAASLNTVDGGFDMEGHVVTGNGTTYAVSTDEKGHTTYTLVKAGTVAEPEKVTPKQQQYRDALAEARVRGMAVQQDANGVWQCVPSRMEPSRYDSVIADAYYERMRDEWGDYTVWK
jgi:hypothetical protein